MDDWQAALDRQLRFACEAFELVVVDIRATTRLGPPSWEFRIEDGEAIRIAYAGHFATSTIVKVDREHVVVEVADFIQDEVIEDLHSPWPVCAAHDAGGYAQVVDHQPVWFCRSGSHVIAVIGQLSR